MYGNRFTPVTKNDIYGKKFRNVQKIYSVKNTLEVQKGI